MCEESLFEVARFPENCVKCPLGHSNPVGSGTVCKAGKRSVVWEDSYNNQDRRAPFCPLKLSISAKADMMNQIFTEPKKKLYVYFITWTIRRDSTYSNASAQRQFCRDEFVLNEPITKIEQLEEIENSLAATFDVDEEDVCCTGYQLMRTVEEEE